MWCIGCTQVYLLERSSTRDVGKANLLDGTGSEESWLSPHSGDCHTCGASRTTTVVEKGRTTIALLDDDAALRRPLAKFLRREGYRCLEFSSAEEFLEAKPLVSLVVSDVEMGAMSGLELRKRLAGATTVVLMSGSGEVEVDLPKPFPISKLTTVVEAALQSAAMRPVDRGASPEPSLLSIMAGG